MGLASEDLEDKAQRREGMKKGGSEGTIKSNVHLTPEEAESYARLEEAAKTYTPLTYWSPEQEEKLRRFYGKVPRELLTKELKHSWNSILSKANKMGLKLPKDEG